MGIAIQPLDRHAFAREVIDAQLWRGFEPADLERIRGAIILTPVEVITA